MCKFTFIDNKHSIGPMNAQFTFVFSWFYERRKNHIFQNFLNRLVTSLVLSLAVALLAVRYKLFILIHFTRSKSYHRWACKCSPSSQFVFIRSVRDQPYPFAARKLSMV